MIIADPFMFFSNELIFPRVKANKSIPHDLQILPEFHGVINRRLSKTHTFTQNERQNHMSFDRLLIVFNAELAMY